VIALVILTYRADPGVFDACLRSVIRSGDADRVIVVDNGQTLDRPRLDALVAAVDGDPDQVVLVVPTGNRGFAGGMNAGLSEAIALGADTIGILNDDTEVEPGWLAQLATALAVEGVGAAQPKLLLVDKLGDRDPDRAPVIQSVGMSVRYDGAGIDVAFGEPDRGQYDAVRPIELFTGAATAFDARFLRAVGGFDERYFLYYEDIDLARRGTDAGWRFVNEPASVVHHAMSSTARTVPGLHRYWQERNRLWWLFRHGSISQILLGLGLSLGRLAKHPTGPQARAILHGLGGLRWCRRERRAGRTLVQPLPMTGPVPWTLQ
jgi:GT2 family glycosyltransferase